MTVNLMNGPSMLYRLRGVSLVALLPLVVIGCSKAKEVPFTEYNDPSYNQSRESSMSGTNDPKLFQFGGQSKASGADAGASGLGVNAYLWRGALDTLSFMPLVSADPFGGVIITDWFTPPSTTGERFKATAYILGRQLRADGVRVALFRQVQQNGQWVDAAVSQATTSEVENKVLARARELRAQVGG
jgi:hypothetical protein